ncbi:MAG: biotin--[acetyl-CoA-carboxylase] ligase [Desulfotomaculales bacterium]
MKDAILSRLRHGNFISGEMLCRQLGVTRTAVWKWVRALRKEGYHIEGRPRLGYRLVGVPDRLYPEEVRRGLHTTTLGRRIFYYHSLPSTNDRAKELARDNAPEGTVVVAEVQTRGRGRLGRQWFSPEGGGLWFSVILRPTLAPSDLPQITLLAAVAGARAVHRVTGLVPGIKWPNDLLLAGRKFAGILTELHAEADRVDHLVLGLGLNANIAPAAFPEELRAAATSLQAELGRPVDRVELFRALLQELEIWYRRWARTGFAPVRSEWYRWNVTLGRPVAVRTAGVEMVGWAEDLDEEGALLVRLTTGTRRRVVAGEVTFLREVGALTPVNPAGE